MSVLSADPVRRYFIPDGVEGVRATLSIMVRLVHQGRKDPTVIATAEQITQSLPAQDIRREADALFKWVKTNVRYVRDSRDTEKINTAERTLRVRCGDCDDMSVLLASLLESIGNKTRFMALGFDGNQYSHVVTQVRLGSAWVTLDPTVATSTLGWIPPHDREMKAHV